MEVCGVWRREIHMQSYESVDELVAEITDEIGGKSGEYAAEIVQYVMDGDAPYIGRLTNVSEEYSAKQLAHGMRALPNVLDSTELDDLEHGRSTATTWKFHKIREALEHDVEEPYAVAVEA